MMRAIKKGINKMDVIQLQYTFLCLYGVEMIIQIWLLIGYKKNHRYRDYVRFLCVNFTILICNVIICKVLNDMVLGLGSGILWLFMTISSSFVNIILLVLAVVFRKLWKKKMGDSLEEDIYFRKGFMIFKVVFLIVVLNVFVLLIFPTYRYRATLLDGWEIINEYLVEKYGDCDFDVVDVYTEFNNGGMWDRYFSGYFYEIESSYTQENFIVYIDKGFHYINRDYFLPVLYSETYQLPFRLYYDENRKDIETNFDKLIERIYDDVQRDFDMELMWSDIRGFYTDYIKSWSNKNGVEYNPNYYIVPNDYGQIPTLQEVEYLLARNLRDR